MEEAREEGAEEVTTLLQRLLLAMFAIIGFGAAAIVAVFAPFAIGSANQLNSN